MTRYAEPWAERIGVPESFVPLPEDHDAAALPGGAEYEPMIEALRGVLNAVAGALPDRPTALRLTEDLSAWERRLCRVQVPEREQAFGHRVDLPGRGQVMAPKFVATDSTPDRVEGTVTFGRYFLGGNGAAHGGAVALFFDEVLGRLSDTGGRPPARTAYLHTDFRAVTPIDKMLTVRAWFEREDSRKRYMYGEIRDGNTLCAEGRGLFLGLRAGQD